MKQAKPTDKERLEQILKAIDLIVEYTEGTTLAKFTKDHKSYHACLFQYTIIAEAFVKINIEILAKHDYPWYKVKSFRNFILHEYQAIDERVVWDTTKIVVPKLKKLVSIILKNEF